MHTCHGNACLLLGRVLLNLLWTSVVTFRSAITARSERSIATAKNTPACAAASCCCRRSCATTRAPIGSPGRSSAPSGGHKTTGTDVEGGGENESRKAAACAAHIIACEDYSMRRECSSTRDTYSPPTPRSRTGALVAPTPHATRSPSPAGCKRSYRRRNCSPLGTLHAQWHGMHVRTASRCR